MIMISKLLRGGLRRIPRCSFSSSLARKTPEEVITLENFRKVQLNRLMELKPGQFDNNTFYHLVGDFLVKPERPDLIIAEQLLNACHNQLPDIDHKGELCSLYLIQLLDSKETFVSQKAVDFVSRLLEQAASLKRDPPAVVTSFMMEFLWENLTKTHSNDAGQCFYDTCSKHSKLLQSIGFSFNQELKERLLLELFLPCRNLSMVNRIVLESVTNNQISISAPTLVEIFNVAIEPEIEDPYPEIELFSDPRTVPRFHALVELLHQWKELGIPIKGESISKALTILFQKFLPSESMLKKLESVA